MLNKTYRELLEMLKECYQVVDYKPLKNIAGEQIFSGHLEQIDDEVINSMDKLISYREPKKPKLNVGEKKGTRVIECSNCHQTIISNKLAKNSNNFPKYCSSCGQRIDWSGIKC